MKSLIIDFSRVLMFAHDGSVESLNKHHQELAKRADFVLFDHFYLNTELLNYLRELGGQFPIYVFTDGKLHELPEVQPKIDQIFSGLHTVEALGLDKKQSASYIKLLQQLKLQATETVFVDDKPANVAAAKDAGLTALVFTSNAQIITELDKFFD